MSRETSYFVQTFSDDGAGGLLGDHPLVFMTPRAAVESGLHRTFTRGSKAGVRVMVHSGDPDLGEFEPPEILLEAGRVPAFA
jgi:hypothetical protein